MQGKVGKAMLQLDVLGYVDRYPGVEESIAVVTGYVDRGLPAFVKRIAKAYCSIPYVETDCGYVCSDHASAWKAGYPSCDGNGV